MTGSSGEARAGALDVVAAAERTALAWERTGFGLVAVGALLVHGSRDGSGPAAVVAGAAVIAAGAVVSVLLAPRRYRDIAAAVRAGHTPLARRATSWLAAVVVLVAAASAALPRP